MGKKKQQEINKDQESKENRKEQWRQIRAAKNGDKEIVIKKRRRISRDEEIAAKEPRRTNGYLKSGKEKVIKQQRQKCDDEEIAEERR